MQHEKILEMHNIVKKFPGVVALKNVHFDLYEGEVHALMGENGAGKSTLLKILSGIHKMDEGEILIRGKKVTFTDASSASKHAIGVVHQELSLALNLTVAENIYLGNVPLKHGVFVDEEKMYTDTQKLLSKIRVSKNIQPTTIVKNLSIAERQMVEIIKALSRKVDILVLDEPTASLTNREIDDFFELIYSLRQQGVSIIYVSHRIEEIWKLADRITILRDGECIWTKALNETDYDDVVSTMVGRQIDDIYPPNNLQAGNIVLSVEHLSTKNGMVKDLSFELRQGEILGFYGLVGSGRSEAMQAILGLLERSSGTITYQGKQIDLHNPKEAQKMGIVLTPESRKDQGLILRQTIDFNITLPHLDEIIHGIRLDRPKNTKIVDGYCKKLNVKTPSYEQYVKNLSGGNQQKVILAKWLSANPKVLILDEPTRGIDIGTKHDIYELMLNLAQNGLAVIFISSELPEIVGISNRVVVMREGKVRAILEKPDISQENIIQNAI